MGCGPRRRWGLTWRTSPRVEVSTSLHQRRGMTRIPRFINTRYSRLTPSSVKLTCDRRKGGTWLNEQRVATRICVCLYFQTYRLMVVYSRKVWDLPFLLLLSYTKILKNKWTRVDWCYIQAASTAVLQTGGCSLRSSRDSMALILWFPEIGITSPLPTSKQQR